MLLVVSIVVCVALHICSHAIVARWAGVAVREVSLGIGPQVVQRGGLRLRLLPFGGAVRLKDTRYETVLPGEQADAFDRQPLGARLLIVSAGAFALLCVMAVGYPKGAVESFSSGFSQFLLGAWSPGHGRKLLASGWTFAHTAAFGQTCGLVASKMLAINLVPFPGSNGFDIVKLLFGEGSPIPSWLTQALLIAMLFPLAMWFRVLWTFVPTSF